MQRANRGPTLLVVLGVGLAGILWLALRLSSAGALHASGAESAGGGLEADLALPVPSEVDRPVERSATRGVPAVAPEGLPGATEPEDVELERVPTVVGRVLGADGAPLAGARVIVSPGYDWYGLPLDLEPSTRMRFRPRHETTTADDGTFAFHEDLDLGTLRLAVSADGHRPLYDDTCAVTDRVPTDLGDVSLARGVVLAGRVVDRAGEGVAGAQLLQRIERGVAGMTSSIVGPGIPLGRTDAKGAFRLDSVAAGPWRLMVDAPGYLVGEFGGRTAKAGDEQTDLILVLDPGATLGGRLVGVPPELLGELSVHARVRTSRSEEEKAAGTPEEAPELPAGAHRARRATPGAGGAFEIGGLQPGFEAVLTVWESDDEGRPVLSKGFEPAHAWPGATGVEFEYRPAAQLSFQVVDAQSGDPIVDLVAAAGYERPWVLLDDDGQVVREHPGGRVRFDELRPMPREAGMRAGVLARVGNARNDDGQERVDVWVRAVGYRVHEEEGVALDVGEHRDLGTIRLEPQAAVRLAVVDAASGEPVEGARAYFSKPDERGVSWAIDRGEDSWGDRRFAFGVTDDRGRVELSAGSGEWAKLWVKADGYALHEDPDYFHDATSADEHRVELTAGAEVLVVARDPRGTPAPGLTIAHIDFSSAMVRNTFLLPEDGDVETDESGVARFANLKPGEHAFTVKQQSGPLIVRTEQLGDDWHRVELREGERLEVEIEAAARGSLEGVVTENGEPLAGASLRLDPVEEGSARSFPVGMGNDPLGAFADFDGSYRFPSVPCGSYELLIDHPDRIMTSGTAVQIEPASTELDIDLAVGIIEGRITDVQGNPVEGARVRADGLDSPRGFGRSSTKTMVEDEMGSLKYERQGLSWRGVETSGDGRYALRGVDTDQGIRLRVTAKGFADDWRAQVKVAPGEIKRDVDFELEAAGWILVTLSEATRDASAQGGWFTVKGELKDAEGRVVQRKSAWAGPGEAAELGGLKEGTWIVQAHQRSGGEVTLIGETTVEVRVGKESTVEL